MRGIFVSFTSPPSRCAVTEVELDGDHVISEAPCPNPPDPLSPYRWPLCSEHGKTVEQGRNA
jgi:hypothetical protein